jgi:DNA-binding response OmpR family regulator
MKKKVLVVDDEDDIRTSVRMILEINGYEVYTASDGDELLNKLNQITPDLILLDIMMPGPPIQEIIKKITNIKIAFMSVVRISDARKRGLCSQENIVDFFQKPFNVTELIDRIELIMADKVNSDFTE